MKRGEVWTIADGGEYASKPRPVAIIQDDVFDATASVTICPFTSDPTDAPLIRLPIEPNARNGLRGTSRLMADKITSVAKSKLGKRIGHLDDDVMLQLNRMMVVFLGLAKPQNSKPESGAKLSPKGPITKIAPAKKPRGPREKDRIK